MRWLALLILVSLAVSGCLPPERQEYPDSIVLSGVDHGGLISAYHSSFDQLASSGKLVVLDGTFQSAATIYLGLPNFCITERAKFYFHGAWPKLDNAAKQRDLDLISMGRFYPIPIMQLYMAKWRYHGPSSFERLTSEEIRRLAPNVRLCL